jgi:hypothetical protein
MDYVKRNKEVFIVIGAMLVFALFILGYFWLFGKDNDSDDPNNINDGNNNTEWNDDEGFKNNKEVINKHLKCTKYSKNDNIVYISEECTIEDSLGQSFKIRLPQINLTGNEITVINNKLKDDYETDKRLLEFSTDNEQLVQVGIFDYIYYDSNKILSLLVKREEIVFDSHSWPPVYDIYNIDKSTGKKLSNEELVESKNITIYNVLGSVQGVIKQIYLEEFDYDVDIIDGDPIVDNYFNSIDRILFDNVFVNNKGNLVALVDLPIPYWSGEEFYLIEIGSNYASYEKEMPL